MWPRIVPGQLDLPWLVLAVLAMREPVVHIELKPCRREEVQRGGRDESVAGQEPAAHGARVRGQQDVVSWHNRSLHSKVAPEAAARPTHLRHLPDVHATLHPPHA